MSADLQAFDVDVTVVDTGNAARRRLTRSLSVLAVDLKHAETAGHHIGMALAEASGWRWKIAADMPVIVRPAEIDSGPGVFRTPTVACSAPYGVHSGPGGAFPAECCPACSGLLRFPPPEHNCEPPAPNLTAVILAMAELVLLSADCRDRKLTDACRKLTDAIRAASRGGEPRG